jgi:AcrR family transcriptional regulator
VQKRSELTKARILKVATKLFSAHGFKAITMKQIAKSSHVTEPAVYWYYPSKKHLCKAVLASITGELDYQSVFSELEREKDIQKLLQRLAAHILTFFAERQEIYRLFLYSALSGHESARKCYDDIRGTYARFLKCQLDRLYREGRIVKKNNTITARCIVGGVFDCALTHILWREMQGQVYSPSSVLTNNIPMYARGLRK